MIIENFFIVIMCLTFELLFGFCCFQIAALTRNLLPCTSYNSIEQITGYEKKVPPLISILAPVIKLDSSLAR